MECQCIVLPIIALDEEIARKLKPFILRIQVRNLSNLYYRQQQMNSAQEWYEKSLDLLEKSDHLYAKPFTALTYCGLGNVELTRRRYDDARRNYKMVLKS